MFDDDDFNIYYKPVTWNQ